MNKPKFVLPDWIRLEGDRCDPLCPALRRPFDHQPHDVVGAGCTRFGEFVEYRFPSGGFKRCEACKKTSPKAAG